MSDCREELLGVDTDTPEEPPGELLITAGDPNDDPNVVEERPEDKLPNDPDNDPEGLKLTGPD